MITTLISEILSLVYLKVMFSKFAAPSWSPKAASLRLARCAHGASAVEKALVPLLDSSTTG
jgi:hypothetical protein